MTTNLSDYTTSFIPGLFNTQLFENLSPLFQANLENQRKNIAPGLLKYVLKLPKDLPRKFDTRWPTNFPEEDLNKWFYRDRTGKWETLITYPLDQAGCGSCWAFATSSQFSDVIRFNLLRLYGQRATELSIFFHPNIVCTGETNITSTSSANGGGVVNNSSMLTRLYAEETDFNISTYFTIAFAPKIKKLSTGKTGLDFQCNQVLDDWKETISTVGRVPTDLKKLLPGGNYKTCMGCQGNLIICPLMQFTGATEEDPNVAEGGALQPDFPLHEWACLWGDDPIRKNFCSPDYLNGSSVRDFPKLYKADYYSYVTASRPIPRPILDQKIENMTDWMMMSIYHYGSISIGFSVYPSFLTYFSKPENGTTVYTAQQFAKDWTDNPILQEPMGGHAVVITGWDEMEIKEGNVDNEGNRSKIIPYWIVRNSWGRKWAEDGFFFMERDIDTELGKINPKIPKIRFDHEFGNLYFAPFPMVSTLEESLLATNIKIPNLNDHQDQGEKKNGKNGGKEEKESRENINDMQNFLLSIPMAQPPLFDVSENMVDLMTLQCNCRCGYSHDAKTGNCERVKLDEIANNINYVSFTENVHDKKEIVPAVVDKLAGAGHGHGTNNKNYYHHNNKKSNNTILLTIIFVFAILMCSLMLSFSNCDRPNKNYEIFVDHSYNKKDKK